MANIESGYKTIRFLYDVFNSYFEAGEILIAGSYYYKKIGCEIDADFKDIDLIVDESKDYIVHDILDYIEQTYSTIFCTKNTWKNTGLIGSFAIRDHKPVDVLRNDFSDMLPRFEIIPGVYSYRLSDRILFNTYEELEEKAHTNNQKYKIIKEFFKARL
jgi:hypothetical protein